jgi:hypothetical protein
MNIVASITHHLSQIESCVPKSDLKSWASEVKDTDGLLLEGLKHLFVRMNPQQRELFETAGQAIIDGTLKIEDDGK